VAGASFNRYKRGGGLIAKGGVHVQNERCEEEEKFGHGFGVFGLVLMNVPKRRRCHHNQRSSDPASYPHTHMGSVRYT
jgi:hypothetical protein